MRRNNHQEIAREIVELLAERAIPIADMDYILTIVKEQAMERSLVQAGSVVPLRRRNDALNALARVWSQSMGNCELINRLLQANTYFCVPPLDAREVESIACRWIQAHAHYEELKQHE